MSVHIAHLTVFAFGIVLALIVYLFTRRGLVELLTRTVAVPGGVTFYQRAFFLVLLFAAVGAALTANLDVKDGQHFMEYVWQIASGVGDTLGFLFLALAIYLVLMTILLGTLKPKNDQ